MQLVGEGEERALGVIFDRHGGLAFSLAYRMCGRKTMAEDIVQEAFLSLWRSGGRYDRARGSVRSWVLSVVHNRAIDAFRRESAVASRDIVDDEAVARLPAADEPERDVARAEEAREVRTALDGLPDRAATGDRARVFRRLQPQRDRANARAPGGNGEGANATWPDEDAHDAWRSGEGRAMTARTAREICDGH